MKIGKLISTLRKKRGLTQIEFASAVGITQASVSCIESGITEPRKKTVIRFCKVLDIPIEFFNILLIEESNISENYNELLLHIKQHILIN
jgi:transcriptional regulator with XRE-family HTH domain